MAKLLALCTLSGGSEAELAFGTKGGGESEESRLRSNILGFIPRKGDHNKGCFFILSLLRFSKPAWRRCHNKAGVVSCEFLLKGLKWEGSRDTVYNHLYNGVVEVEG